MPKPTRPAGRNKYNAKPTVYKGVRYASKSEAAWAEALDGLREAGVTQEVVRQPKFHLGVPENVYVADFTVIAPYESPFLIEGRHYGTVIDDVKGVETAKFNRDIRLWQAYGRLPLRIIKRGKVSRLIVPDCFQGE